MTKNKKIKIIYFVRGILPSNEAFQEAEKLFPAQVVFRNANHIKEGECLEKCDAVTGDVPKGYSEKYPSAEDLLKKIAAEKAELQKTIDDNAKAAAKAEKAAEAEKKKAEAAAAKAQAEAEKTPPPAAEAWTE